MKNIMHKHYRLKENNSLKLWERWVLASTIAQIIGWIVIAYFSQATNEFVNENTYKVLLLVGTVEGLALGFAQWLVLRRYIRYASYWIFFTIAGVLISWFMGLTISAVIGLFYVANFYQEMTTLVEKVALLGAAVGTVIGYAQWLILKTVNKQAIWWVTANALAWSLGLVVAFFGAGINKSSGFSLYPSFVTVATGAVMGIMISSITGIVLVWLLKPRLRHYY
ncbi:hypothetical protein Riv7116_3043 [Rivularia sp. PCC 7116]|uniref:hypothetical protein n=1 Tax=Rivularia sp. PCC 7116 TaxID=373994 RepID=UPI00029EFC39|nr:hypothetical protein [Rivularia sp. PCC 7116]AFY55522.1 hypothetical protein Riv7116_3043 [Rivularia sp. PCC 7116]